MFEQLKDLKKAQEMQKAFAREKHTVEEAGIKVTVNGNLKLEEIQINSQISQEELGPTLVNLINRSLQEIQQRLARQLME